MDIGLILILKVLQFVLKVMKNMYLNMELYLKGVNSKKIIVIISFLHFLFLNGCAKAGCDDCVYQKQEFCKAMFQVNCNSVYLTDNIDLLVRACGNDDATSFISSTTQNCQQGNLTCPQCE
jgi:hypothetical protein